MKRPESRRTSSRVSDPLVWTFGGTLAESLADLEDTLRRAIVQLGDVAGIVVAIDISLPALARRVAAGDVLQPAWKAFLHRVTTRYGLPLPPRIRHLREDGPLATLVILYRS